MKLTILFAIFSFICVQAHAQGGLEEFVRAENLYNQKKFKEALVEYNNAITKDAKNYKFHFHQGKCFLLVKEEDNAIKAFQKTVELQKDFVEAYEKLAKLYEKNKQLDQAILAYDNAFKYDTDAKKKLSHKLSVIKNLQKAKKFTEAGNHINDAKQLAPDDLQVLYYDAKFNNETGKYALALASMEKATKSITSTDPKEIAKYWYEMGFALTMLERHPEAQAALAKAKYGPYVNKVMKLSPQYFHSLGTSYYKVYDLDKAKSFVDRSLKVDPAFARSRDLQLKIAQDLTDKASVIDHYKTSIETERDPVIRSNKFKDLADMELQNRRYEDAIKSANECLKVQPKNYAVIFTKAMALYKLNRTDEAVKTTIDMLQIEGIDPETKAQYHFALGIFYQKLGKKTEAIASFKNAHYGSFKYAAKEEHDKLAGPEEEHHEEEGAAGTTTEEKH